MNCANHPEAAAAAFCRDCGKPLCAECIRPARGSVFCAEHVPAPDAVAPETSFAAPPANAPMPPSVASSLVSPSPSSSAWSAEYEAPIVAPPKVQHEPGVHPAIALLLGFIPGVGAICNGQYAKGLIHAMIFGLLVTAIANSHGPGTAPILGIMIAAWVSYMVFEAFHTASRRRRGIPVEEFSSLFDVRGGRGKLPLGAILLVAVGFLLLLNTTDIVSIEVFARYWPAGLIALGIYLLYARVSAAHGHDASHDAEEWRR